MPEASSALSPAALEAEIARRLGSLTTLSLATVDPQGAPCAAAVYFVHDEALALYFLSARTTVHGINMLATPKVAATAHDEHQEWKTLSGLQLAGEAHPVGLIEFPQAARLYNRKYPFVDLLKAADDKAALAKAMAATTIWKLVPTWIRLIDNARGFGFKQELALPHGPGAR